MQRDRLRRSHGLRVDGLLYRTLSMTAKCVRADIFALACSARSGPVSAPGGQR